ncbi:MAG: winged helix-turn-helix transcriptional regulator [Planctomycetes bacterium]|nr:winged helix-turn-helix transcriptional regulator [Planctomycetota bacterium]
MVATAPVSQRGIEPAEILGLLRRIIHSVHLHSRRMREERQITGPQHALLQALREAGPLPPGRLARTLYVSPSTVTGIVDRLEARGLVRREHDREDRRVWTVALTDEGLEAARRIPSPLRRQIAEGLAALPGRERRHIARALDTLSRLVETHEGES